MALLPFSDNSFTACLSNYRILQTPYDKAISAMEKLAIHRVSSIYRQPLLHKHKNRLSVILILELITAINKITAFILLVLATNRQ